jgi:transcriptional regulator with XRE-family HTH domain
MAIILLIMTKLSEKIKILRKAQGITQLQLAEMLNTTQKVITTYETGLRKPPIERLPALAKILGVTIEELIGEKNINISTTKQHTHKNSRSAQIETYFNLLTEDEQRAILKQVKALANNNK